MSSRSSMMNVMKYATPKEYKITNAFLESFIIECIRPMMKIPSIGIL